jgi:hypothetical protein
MIAAPVFAQATDGRISVPEPATIGVLAVGAGAAFVARKFLGRK